MGLVRQRDEQGAWLLFRQRGDVGFLALAPFRFRFDPRVRAVGDDRRHGIAEALPNFLEDRFAALVFDRIVEEGGDSLILVAAVLEDECGDGEQVGNVGDIRALSTLLAVEATGIRRAMDREFSRNG